MRLGETPIYLGGLGLGETQVAPVLLLMRATISAASACRSGGHIITRPKSCRTYSLVRVEFQP
jgi:hypothetical protein